MFNTQKILAAIVTRGSVLLAGSAGSHADFIVLDANPIDNIANTRRIDPVILRRIEMPREQDARKWQAQFRPKLAQAALVD